MSTICHSPFSTKEGISFWGGSQIFLYVNFNKSVVLSWISGHMGHKGNASSNALIRQGTRLRHVLEWRTLNLRYLGPFIKGPDLLGIVAYFVAAPWTD